MNGPLILVLPALGVAPGYYEPLMAGLREQLQAQVIALPTPQPKNWRERLGGRVKYGYAELVRDACVSASELQSQHPGRPLLLLGHSLGGHVALLAATHLGDSLSGIMLVASGVPYWRVWPRQQRLPTWVAIATLRFLSWLLPWYPGDLLGFGGSQSRRLMRDWSLLARTGSMQGLRGLSAEVAALDRLALPLLSISVPGDLFAPASATDHLLLACPRVKRSHVALDDTQLLALRPGRRHIAWIRRPDAVLREIKTWCQKHLAKSALA